MDRSPDMKEWEDFQLNEKEKDEEERDPEEISFHGYDDLTEA